MKNFNKYFATKIGKISIASILCLIVVFGFFFFTNPSLKKVSTRDNTAQAVGDSKTLWNDLHPDDRVRWKDYDEYAAMIKSFESVKFSSVKIKDIKQIASWVNTLTGKTYSNIQLVTSTYTDEEGLSSDSGTYYEKINGKWYFFSTRLASSDREHIKLTAVSGPSYKELSKSPEKFKGQNVKYTGKVVQIQEDSRGNGYLRLSLANDVLSDIVYVNYSTSTDSIEGDIVTVYGTISGSMTYTSQANYQITLPAITAAVIEKPQKAGSEASQSSSTHTIAVGQKIVIGSYSLIVKSADACKSEYDDEDPDKKHIAVSVSQTNTGLKTLKYNAYDFMLVDFFGDKHSVMPIFCTGNQFIGGEIEPGETIDGYFGFDIETYALPSKLIISPVTVGSNDLYIINF